VVDRQDYRAGRDFGPAGERGSPVSSLLRRADVRVEVLDDRDRGELIALVDADPLVNCVVSARLRAFGTLEPRTFGGPMLGVRDASGRLSGAAFAGANLLPVGGGPAEWDALGTCLADGPRHCTSIVGRADAVAGLWSVLSPGWGRPRAVRHHQPLLALDRSDPLPAGDPQVGAARPEQLERYLPAAAAMFSEELGISPYEAPGDYRRRVAGLIAEGRAFCAVDAEGEVVFKADLGAVSAHTCQVQGVWVRPDRRGIGIGAAGLATVLRHALTLAPTVSLYVNDYNRPARRMYERLGMREAAVLRTILF
jgi:hypothetical protein